MAGYTPEEIQAFRLKMAGNSVAPLGKGLTEFDKKASDVSASLSRVADKVPFLPSVGASSPATPMVRDAAEQLDLNRKGGIGSLSTATQSALAKPQAPEQLQALNSPTPDVQAAPSLKEQLLSKLRGGGGGGPGTGGLYAAFQSARKRQLGDFDTDKELAIEQGENKAQHTMTMAEWLQADAAERQRHAQIDMDAQEAAHQKTQDLIGRNQQLADDIGKQKIDPSRLAKNMGTGERISHVLGSALGGFLRGFQGGENKTLERFDHAVSQDIQAQLNEIDNKKAQLGARQNLVAQMIQETGDRRLGVLAARNLYYEAAKQKLAATDAQLGVPEITTAAKQTANVFQHQQDGMNAQFTGEALRVAQAQAAAQAAAQKAAEREAWQRQMDLAKLGIERDKLSIEQMKAMGMSGEDIAKQSAQLGDKLAAPELAQGRAAVDASKMRLDKAGPGEGLPGVGVSADLREKLAGRPTGMTALLPSAWVANKVAGLSDEERVSRNDWEKVKLAYRKQITGSGGSAEEMKVIEAAFEGAKTPAEQRAAINNADALFKQIESRHKAGYDPRAVQRYETNLAGQAGIQPRQGNVSDERAKQLKKKLGGY
jgi:hypothetical protein